MVVEDLLPAVHLHHCDIVTFLVFTNLRADIHTTRQQLQQLAVDVIDFATETCQVALHIARLL